MIDICPWTLPDLRSKQFFKSGVQEKHGNPPAWDAGPLQGYPSLKFAGTYSYTWAERGTVRVECLSQDRGEKNRSNCSVQVKCTNYDPPQLDTLNYRTYDMWLEATVFLLYTGK